MGTIRLQTPVPGPRSQAVLAARQTNVPRGVANVTPVVAYRAEGATLTDLDGNVFLDFAGGIGVLNLGASHPEVVAAAKEQLDRFAHTCFNVTMYEPYVDLAAALNRITPGSHAKKTLLVNSGAEAVENAIKIARRHTGRSGVVTFTHAFHGRTLLTMSLTGKVSTYKYGFGPFAPEVYRLPAVYAYRSPFADEEAAAAAALAEVTRSIEEEIGKDQVAAMIIEPVQGEGGFLVQPAAFMQGLRDLCDKHGIMLIADEIQTGFARTGKMFACDHFSVVPDLITTAKSLGNGLPIAAVTGRAEVMDAPQVGGLGGTYSGNPVACAAALKVIEVMERDDLPARSASVGEQVMARFRNWQQKYELVGDVRGLGAMCAIELVKDRATKEPATEETAAIFDRALANGVLMMKAGNYNHVIRFLAPLAISDAQLTEGLDVLEEAVAHVSPVTAR